MASVNKVILLGHLGQNPDLRYTTSGEAVVNLSLATSETWKDRATGEKREATEWHRIGVFGKPAEIAAQYLSKGSQIYVEGKIRSKKYTDKNGVERVAFEIISDSFTMIGKAPDQATPKEAPKATKQPEAKDDAFMNDDIPFN
jgi:single-strand DNA-binding protein